MALASVSSKSLSNYYESFQIGQQGSVGLVRGDGQVLARAPFDEATLALDISKGELFARHLSLSDAGAYHYVSPVDGVERIGGFYRSWRSQLTVLAAVGQNEAIAKWAQGAVWRWAAIGAVLLMGTGLSVVLFRQTKAMRRADRLLARETLNSAS